MAGASDVVDVAGLTAQLGYGVPASALAQRLTRILQERDQRVMVADVDGRVVGWLHAAIRENLETDPYVDIAGLVVDAAHRGRGIGRKLMAEAEKWARERQCRVVRLRSSAGRTAAHRFYESLGYTNIKTQYSFAKSLDGGDLSGFVPRIDPGTA